LARFDEMKELLAGDVGARPVRHHDSVVLDGLEAQVATVLWMRKNSEHKGQVQEEEEAEGKAKSRTCARCAILKGVGLVDVKCALNANHTASRTKLASHAQRANDVPVYFS
jgi:hypothetical protein